MWSKFGENRYLRFEYNYFLHSAASQDRTSMALSAILGSIYASQALDVVYFRTTEKRCADGYFTYYCHAGSV